jgi:hypothetical protein
MPESQSSMAPRPKLCPFSYDIPNRTPMSCGEWCRLWVMSKDGGGACTFTWLAANSEKIANALEQLAMK